jgi:type IV pilus assembly protein PilY1
VLVGSQGRGGRQVFALDITDPDTFGTTKVLWEFTDSDFGKFIGKPVFTRLNTGRWAVLLGNGYNSDQNRGFLFVIDALTGALIRKIDTGPCPTADDPCVSNGLADMTPWDDDGDGNVDYAYAGDLRGNVWRFDIGSATASEWKVSFGTTDSPLPLYRARDAAASRSRSRRTSRFCSTRQMACAGSASARAIPGRPDRADMSVQTWYGLYDNYASGTTTSPVTGRSNMAQRVVLFETGPISKAPRT